MTQPSMPRGLLVDLVTPLKSNGRIDGRSLERLLNLVLPHVQAVLLAGPDMGEGLALDNGQREELLSRALPGIAGRVPALVWISRDTESRTLETFQILKKVQSQIGYDGRIVWVDAPLIYHSNRGLPQLYQEYARESQDSFLLHNDPDLIRNLGRNFKRNNIRTSILKEVSQIPPVKGLIFFGPLPRFHHYQRAIRLRSSFRIYDGNENRFLMYPSLSGVLSAGANLTPRTWKKVLASSLDLDGVKAEYPDQLHQIWRAGSYLIQLQHIYKKQPVVLIKRLLAEMGILDDPHALSAETAEPEKVAALKKLMRQFGDLSA